MQVIYQDNVLTYIVEMGKKKSMWIMSKKNSKPDSIKFKHCKMCTNVAIVNHKTIIFEKKKKNK